MENLAQKKKCDSQVSTKVGVASEPALVEVPLSAVVDCEHDDAALPVPPRTEASSELFPKSNKKHYPSTGQTQTQNQNEVAY